MSLDIPNDTPDARELADMAQEKIDSEAIANSRMAGGSFRVDDEGTASGPRATPTPQTKPRIGASGQGNANAKPESRVVLVRASSVTPRAVPWLWDGWLAAGKIHVLAGPPGAGKTTLAVALAAKITSGGRWPDGTRADAGDIAIWSGEDGIADTLVPRLRVNGADMDRVHFVEDVADGSGRRPFDPAKDIAALADALASLPNPPKLLIVDPIVSAVAGDSHKNAETRRSLQPLADLAERVGCAVLGISHFSKGTSGRDPVERVTGSLAFGAVSRIVLAAVKTTDEDGNPGPRLFARAKSNIGPDGGGFHYALEQVETHGVAGVQASRVMWGTALKGEARDLLAAADDGSSAKKRGAADDVRSWLVRTLREADGPMERQDLIELAKRAGISARALDRAATRADVSKRTSGFGPLKRSVWTLAEAEVGTNPANLRQLS